jgi:hypothetical protein
MDVLLRSVEVYRASLPTTAMQHRSEPNGENGERRSWIPTLAKIIADKGSKDAWDYH